MIEAETYNGGEYAGFLRVQDGAAVVRVMFPRDGEPQVFINDAMIRALPPELAEPYAYAEEGDGL